ncbi:hypothetical protein BT69DRAFT_1287722 [Atractiella rhizophila]|nr:hypothetical protein BT69DRAFT_1287722 [Atractiella rhizophila]
MLAYVRKSSALHFYPLFLRCPDIAILSVTSMAVFTLSEILPLLLQRQMLCFPIP